jgi:hypothetical protein
MRASWVLASALLLSSVARADMMAPPPLAERLTTASVVVVGKVTKFEEKAVEASRSPNAPKELFRVAVVTIAQDVKGVKGLTSIRVGYVPPVALGRRRPVVNLKVDQEAIFFLKKHHDQDFYVAPFYYDVVNKGAPEPFDKDVAFLKECGKILQNPAESLKSKDVEQRFLAAALLVGSYRHAGEPGKMTRKPIDADESKRILLAIADADWSKPSVRGQLSPQITFGQLGLTPEDGWQPMAFKNFATEYPAAAKKWLRDNADRYRIQKYVVDEVKK